jgi:hypothetical protein
MAEPLDPAVLGVASALKSLRTRIGLREERLRGTEVVLDTLTGLDGVRVLVNAGQSPERAVVHAVRAAAGTLEPTMSIVADASLGLRLFADQVPDSDLYAEDLTQRRKALLRNWDRLHDLRSVPPGKPPSPRALRLEVESEALTALAAALTASARTDRSFRALTGADEPRVRELRLDDAPDSLAVPTLLQTFLDVGRALRGKLIRNDDGAPTGWQQNLGGPRKEATAVSTAYGIRTMLLLEDRLAVDLIPVAERLKGMAHETGGYASSGHKEPSAEATAAVLNALGRIAATENFDMHIAQMEKGLTDFEKARPFILTTMLEASLLLRRGESLVGVLVDSLLAARRSYGGRLVWPENSNPELIHPKPSVAHTARAVRALADVRAIQPDNELEEALEQAVDWLLERSDLHNTDESIERVPPVGTYHFTAAWVVKALVSAGVAATHPAVRDAVSLVWDSYAGDKGDKDVALWSSHRGDLPIWTTFDAIEALRLASLGSTPGPADRRHREAGVTGLSEPTTIVR